MEFYGGEQCWDYRWDLIVGFIVFDWWLLGFTVGPGTTWKNYDR